MRKKFKRNLCWLVSIVLLLSFGIIMYVETNVLGSVRYAQRRIDSSAIFTAEEIHAAMDAAMAHFRAEFGGCKLIEMVYDEEKSVQRSAEWAAQYGAEQAIVLDSTFEVRSKDAWATGLEWGKTYRGWSWILVRNENGPWQLKTWGYG